MRLIQVTQRLIDVRGDKRAWSLHIAGPRTQWDVRRWEWTAGKLSSGRWADIATTVADRTLLALLDVEALSDGFQGLTP
jgi:hypothetical protein